MTKEQFEYDISIEANGEKDADLKMDALLVFATRFTSAQLQGLKKVIQTEPEKVDFILDSLNL